MFSTGSKYFIGVTALSVVALIMLLIVTDQVALAGVALSMLIVASALLTGLVVVTRDGNTTITDAQPTSQLASQSASQLASQSASQLTNQPMANSMWPLMTSIGLVFLALGLVTSPVVFFGGVVVLVAALAEWMVQVWSEQASPDADYNASARKRLLNPIEFPVLAAVGLGVIIFSFSRIMLSVNKSAGTALFVVLGALVLTGGTLFAIRPNMKHSVGAAICVLGAFGIVAGGITGATSGVREDLVVAMSEDHFSHRECGPERSEYFDKNVTKTLSLRSSVIATIEFVNGELVAKVHGVNEPQKSIMVPRSSPFNIIFNNRSVGEYRLVADLGTNVTEDGGKEKLITCTQMTPQNAEQALTLNIAKPSNTGNDYSLTVAGVEGQSIEMVVP